MKPKNSQSGQFGIMVIVIALAILAASLSISVQVNREMKKIISDTEGLQKLNEAEGQIEDLLNQDDFVDIDNNENIEKIENPEIFFKEGETLDAEINNDNCKYLEIFWNSNNQNNNLLVTFYREVNGKIIANQYPLRSGTKPDDFIGSLSVNTVSPALNNTKNYQAYYKFTDDLTNTKLIKIQLLNGETYINLRNSCAEEFVYRLKAANEADSIESRQINLLVTNKAIPVQFQYALFTPNFEHTNEIVISDFVPATPTSTPIPTVAPTPLPTDGH
jgi:hypothetical protein